MISIEFFTMLPRHWKKIYKFGFYRFEAHSLYEDCPSRYGVGFNLFFFGVNIGKNHF